MKKLLKNRNGITLIALVITIIVLLILAGVSVAFLTGDKGILTQGITAKEETKKASIQEQRQLAMTNALINNKNQNYTDKNGDTAIIPTGFAITGIEGETEIDKGLVIIDNLGNEFVWVPITDINILAKKTSGIDSNNRTNYQGKLYNFFNNGEDISSSDDWRYGQGNYLNNREPSLITGDNSDSYAVLDNVVGSMYDADSRYYHYILGYNNVIEFGKAMQEEFNIMVESVNKYGGFYVGRYETSIDGTTVASVKGNMPIQKMNWYKIYLYMNNKYENNPFHSNTNVTSSMIWGSQWDAMLNWILTGSNRIKVMANTNGNHSGSIMNTGTIPTDVMNNIYDLEGNATEWTQEAWYSALRVFRGGDFTDYGNSAKRSNRDALVDSVWTYASSRFSLFIN